jgi:type IV pilus assembly protein PilX
MHPRHRFNRQRGAALIVGLMMLVVVTLLAVTAVSTSNTELIMAGNEQFRERAFQAAEAGIETAYRKLRSGDTDVPINVGTFLDNNDVAMVHDTHDLMSTRIEPYGANVLVGNSSKFIGQVYRVTSTGESLRNSRSTHEAGVWVLAPFDDSNQRRLTGQVGDDSTSAFGAL